MPNIALKDRVKAPLVRAWFDTVINPLIRGLTAEASVLAGDDLTWRAPKRDFASLASIRSLVSAEFWDNLAQLRSIYPELELPISDHDEKLQRLRTCVAKYHNALAEYMKDKALAAGMISQASQPSEERDVAAEYIINRVSRLPNYYSTADYWNAHSDKFLDLARRPEFQPIVADLEDAKSKFKDTVDVLYQELAHLRSELSLDYGEPIVTGITG